MKKKDLTTAVALILDAELAKSHGQQRPVLISSLEIVLKEVQDPASQLAIIIKSMLRVFNE